MSKILIVDDEERNLKLLEAMLIPHGYEIELAENGEIALAKVDDEIPDLVLLDIMMPKMDGFMVCERLKANERTREIPIIFLTAKTDSESVVKAFDIGAVDYVSKPFKAPELIARVKTHINLKNTQEALQIANATKTKFFSIIAHDLKNPFSSLLGYTSILLKKYSVYDDDRKMDMLTTIRDASQRAYNLLENLLDWSRKQSGQIVLHPERLEMHDLAEKTIDLVKTEADRKRIQVINQMAPEINGYGDLNTITLVLRNLVSNAIKFTSENGEIRIEGRKAENEIEITVADTGVGIAEDVLPRLFKLEEHFVTEGTRHEKGSGLGLILCKEFVEENGGRIQVESEEGIGSRFTFTLPLDPPA